jgi:hypothetical protein
MLVGEIGKLFQPSCNFLLFSPRLTIPAILKVQKKRSVVPIEESDFLEAFFSIIAILVVAIQDLQLVWEFGFS